MLITEADGREGDIAWKGGEWREKEGKRRQVKECERGWKVEREWLTLGKICNLLVSGSLL